MALTWTISTTVIFFILNSFINVVLAAYAPDEVTNLPGLKTQPTFRHYSGYLNASGEDRLHYWFVESENDPANDPVVLWMNGGPGCSSMDGMLSELGPFHVNNDGQSLYMNEFSWNKVANVIFLEAPAGVGYSYNPSKEYATDDDKVSMGNYLALQSFFKKFPEYASNEFYVTGESYGGIYVPTLSLRILQGNATINMKGFAVGNGITNFTTNSDSLVYFAYYHGLIGLNLWKGLNDKCCDGTYCVFTESTDTGCLTLVRETLNIVYNIGLNTYSLYLDCYNGPSSVKSPLLTRYQFDMQHALGHLPTQPPKYYQPMSAILSKSKLGVVPPCINVTGVTAYLNLPAVRKALHIAEEATAWEICSALPYKTIYATMYDTYKSILTQYRGLVYNGDTDMACNFLGDEWFIESLNLKQKTDRAPWKLGDQIAGFVKEFEGLSLVTVKGSGHMVPQERPAQALKMITSFLQNKPL
ncbi:lysosomal protective protein [Strongylocentrotus purpuratus]|uniref:Carboxypeptidase n=1 Tax=Strongylocentrotus purpuratus TaxID=7668 RepID=A0A7M7RHI9_STRPU|nr:lysosomal protective protein [Strongylocentrotus purpuratus]